MAWPSAPAVFFVAILDDFVVLARGGSPAYRAAETAHRAEPDLGGTT